MLISQIQIIHAKFRINYQVVQIGGNCLR